MKCTTLFTEENFSNNSSKVHSPINENLKKCDTKSVFQNQLNDVSLSTTHSFNKFFSIQNSNIKEKSSRPIIDNLFRQQVYFLK